MTVQLTKAGEQAFELVQWAFEDPANRAEHARQKVAEIHAISLQERNEVGDAATMLSRLAGSLEPDGRNISEQVREDSG